MLLLLTLIAILLSYRPADKKHDTYNAVLRSPKPCGLGAYPGVQEFMKAPERDWYDLTVEYGYHVPTLIFLDVDEQELGRVYITENYTAATIKSLLDEADIRVRR